uniref:Uncharacterized protein n=1 Tax=Rhizophora mucronata TaxID=61149 RepID=A0A2P2QYN6_RHIMU
MIFLATDLQQALLPDLICKLCRLLPECPFSQI